MIIVSSCGVKLQEVLAGLEKKVKKCDLLSENPALPTNIEFELEAILSVQVVFQLNSDYCIKVVKGLALYRTKF